MLKLKHRYSMTFLPLGHRRLVLEHKRVYYRELGRLRVLLLIINDYRLKKRTRHMSWNPAIEPGCPDEVGVEAIETLIVPRACDLGGFEVRRALPAPNRQMVGPFIFFDQAGPAELLTGRRGRSTASAHRSRHRDLPL